MPKPFLLVLLLAALTGVAATAHAHGPNDGASGETLVQIIPGKDLPLVYRQIVPWPDGAPMLGHTHYLPRVLRETPWHYHPEGPCVPPYCLPSYHRHRLPVVSRPPLPLELILGRLAQHDYHGFGGILLDGPLYWIGAWSRYGQPVRLIVDAASGQIRGLVTLPQW